MGLQTSTLVAIAFTRQDLNISANYLHRQTIFRPKAIMTLTAWARRIVMWPPLREGNKKSLGFI